MNKMKILLIIMLVVTTNCYAGIVYPTAKMTVKVVDETGKPVPGTKVYVSFDVAKGSGQGWGTATKTKSGFTDDKGLFTTKETGSKTCNSTASKQGYYLTGKAYTFKERSVLNRWEPWNPTIEIKLKKKRNPIPMYAKRTNLIEVPALDKLVGYDLEKGDWVVPYGKGVISDFVFVFKTRFNNRKDWECSYVLTFTNEHDGIQEYDPSADYSSYKWPFNAPETAYKPKVSWSSIYYKGKKRSDYKEGKRYMFRVRTKVDEKGNIIEAKYGKIGGDIRLYASGKIKFNYYYNPTGTRNLEYDPKQPLFKWRTRNERNKHKITTP